MIDFEWVWRKYITHNGNKIMNAANGKKLLEKNHHYFRPFNPNEYTLWK